MLGTNSAGYNRDRRQSAARAAYLSERLRARRVSAAVAVYLSVRASKTCCIQASAISKERQAREARGLGEVLLAP
jgi:hypothetical protein